MADHDPKAWINIITNPVNSTVPIISEVLKSKGVWDPRKLFGMTTLDVVRANTFLAELKGLRLIDMDVPLIGGHAGATILLLVSKAKPAVMLTEDEAAKLTVRIQNASTEVVEAKAGAGSATLSMAYAAARFAESCMRAMDGNPDVFECTYVTSDVRLVSADFVDMPLPQTSATFAGSGLFSTGRAGRHGCRAQGQH
ncbi:hypothetical protein CLOM_g23252 [Closterium sp. NIES-68]|nr:hypothetical protein CLOM_g23252 [Closterium sp. NIES-68]